jgi:predicted nucleic acid-binding protein
VIGLDSSALIRYLTNDDPEAAARVEAFLDGDEPVQVSSPVLLESVHVLRGQPYLIAYPDLADSLVEFLAHQNVVLSGLDRDLTQAAIRGSRERSPRHIADAIIAAAARDAGCRVVVTTDQRFATDLIPIEQLGS